LIVSRKGQSNKKKLSPLTNHKNTKNGIVKGGFGRVNLFRQAEQGFDKLFGYERQQTESFDYQNVMKNGSILEQFELQEQEIQSSERKTEINQCSNQENLFSIHLENKEASNQAFNTNTHIFTPQENNTSIDPSFYDENNQTSNSFISFISLQKADFQFNSEEQIPKLKKTTKFWHSRIKATHYVHKNIKV
jgi:hypothetical protein